MSFSTELAKAIRGCLNKGIPFAIWREPNALTYHFCANPSFTDGCGDILQLGFAVNMWNSDRLLVIANELSVNELIDKLDSITLSIDTQQRVYEKTTDRAHYLAAVDRLIAKLKQCGGKTVYSRITCGESESVDWTAVAEAYFDMYGSAFAYLYYTPMTGAWLGASPELLLQQSADGEKVATMSLAGTRGADTPGKWDEKNRDEQAMVTGFIADTLRENNMTVNLLGPDTLKYGRIEHLCTHIEGIATEKIDFIALANQLSPTPALAGLPRKEALADIAELESHDRKCYGGYVAVRGASGLSAYVNLRCVNFDHENWCIYSGGGITAASTAEAEWAESEAKASVLRDLILKK